MFIFFSSKVHIANSAFRLCYKNLTLHIPERSNAIAYAEKENLQYDFKTKFVPTTTAPPVQQAALQPEKMEPPASAQPDVFGTVIPESDFLSLHPNTLDRYTGTEKELIIPEGIQVIGENAFLLKPIISMVVSEGVRTLSDSAFYSCSCLTEITLPDTLKVIGKRTFQNCIKLTQIVIPESVTTIGENAFAGCSALQDVYLPGIKIQIGSNAFPKNVTIHAPEVSDGTIYARQNSILVEHDLTP